MQHRVVALSAVPSEPAQRAVTLADATLTEGGVDVPAALDVARELASTTPLPGRGRTLALWEVLASLGAADLTVARVAEPHLDAVAILAEARDAGHTFGAQVPDDATWGVFAAEGPRRLQAVPHSADSWSLEGEKPWCSLAEELTHALVTAWVGEAERRLFLVDLEHPGIRAQADPSAWAARGLTAVRSTGLDFSAVDARTVGGANWYLERPGFAWGGAGVAAIWYGGTVGVARRLRASALERDPDQVALMHLGAVDAALTRARATLVAAASVADRTSTSAAESARTAQRVRQVVADTADEVLTRVGHALGPAPLARDEEHARRVADLTVYLRQHHGERDQARLGDAVLGDTEPDEWQWW